MSALLGLLLCAVPPSSVVAATHDGVLTADAIRWSSVLVLEGPPRPIEIPLAVPLTESVRMAEPLDGTVSLVRDAHGSVVALEASERALVDSDGAHSRLVLSVTQRIASEQAPVHLEPPLSAGPAVQAVRLTGGDGAHFEPAPELGIERHVGFWAAPRVDPRSREAVLELARASAGDWIFLTAGPELTGAGGLVGSLTTFEQRSRPAVFVAGGVFGSLVLAFSALHRRLARRTEAERADAVLAAEIALLDRQSDPPRAQGRPSRS
jgi:hypothetical protein